MNEKKTEMAENNSERETNAVNMEGCRKDLNETERERDE